MNDYMETCDRMACSAKAERKVWRWAEYRRDGFRLVELYRYRDDHHAFHHLCGFGFSRTEYDGDERGNPIAGAQDDAVRECAREAITLIDGYPSEPPRSHDEVEWEREWVTRVAAFRARYIDGAAQPGVSELNALKTVREVAEVTAHSLQTAIERGELPGGDGGWGGHVRRLREAIAATGGAAQPGELSAQELLEMGFGFVGYKGGKYDLFVNWEQPCISGSLSEVLAAARKMAGGAA